MPSSSLFRDMAPAAWFWLCLCLLGLPRGAFVFAPEAAATRWLRTRRAAPGPGGAAGPGWGSLSREGRAGAQGERPVPAPRVRAAEPGPGSFVFALSRVLLQLLALLVALSSSFEPLKGPVPCLNRNSAGRLRRVVLKTDM